MTYAEICAELITLGGSENTPGAFVMPTPELLLIPQEDYTVRGVSYEGAVVAEARTIAGEYVTTFANVGRGQVASMLADLSAQAKAFVEAA